MIIINNNYNNININSININNINISNNNTNNTHNVNKIALMFECMRCEQVRHLRQ